MFREGESALRRAWHGMSSNKQLLMGKLQIQFELRDLADSKGIYLSYLDLILNPEVEGFIPQWVFGVVNSFGSDLMD